jgi:hypothetical protein
MAMRRSLVAVLVGAVGSLGASYPTSNFVVDAPTAQIAQQVGQAAEHYRRQKALEWLGREMAPWAQPCPIVVRVTLNGPGGATQFAFDRGIVRSQHMQIEGPLDRILESVLPHEVTHTVFADFFRCPVPRWADEGGAVLSEDAVEKERHDRLVRQVLNTPGRMIPLRRLFALREYPGDVMVLYAEGFSVANYLVSISNKPTFLHFVAGGMTGGWDTAVKTYYRLNSVEELEQAWLAHLRATKRPPGTILAQNTPAGTAADPTNRVVVRQTVPPIQPAPVYRGQAPAEPERDRLTLARQAASRPGYLPEAIPSLDAGSPTPDSPRSPGASASTAPAPGPAAPRVQLGSPQPALTQSTDWSRSVPRAASPVGYPQ